MPRAECVGILTLLSCQRLSQGVGARRRVFARPAWPRCTLLWHDNERASRKPAPHFPPSLRHHVSPRAEQIVYLTHSRCQRLSQGAGARRRLFERHPFFFYRGGARSHGRAGIALGTTAKYPQCTTAQRPENYATHTERRRGQRTGHLDQKYLRRTTSGAAGNGLSRYHGSLHHKRPALTLFKSCLIRQQTEWHCRGLGFRCPVIVCAWSPSLLLVFVKKSTPTYVIFFSSGSKLYYYFLKTKPASRKPALPRRRASGTPRSSSTTRAT
jgi:hypothetical protein